MNNREIDEHVNSLRRKYGFEEIKIKVEKPDKPKPQNPPKPQKVEKTVVKNNSHPDRRYSYNNPDEQIRANLINEMESKLPGLTSHQKVLKRKVQEARSTKELSRVRRIYNEFISIYNEINNPPKIKKVKAQQRENKPANPYSLDVLKKEAKAYTSYATKEISEALARAFSELYWKLNIELYGKSKKAYVKQAVFSILHEHDNSNFSRLANTIWQEKKYKNSFLVVIVQKVFFGFKTTVFILNTPEFSGFVRKDLGLQSYLRRYEK